MSEIRSFRELKTGNSALDCGYISEEEHADFDSAHQEVGAMINGMIQRSSSFCLQSKK